MLFGTESSECGFEIKLIAYETIEKCDFTITNNGNCSLDTIKVMVFTHIRTTIL